MNIDFKEEDIDILDKMLEYIMNIQIVCDMYGFIFHKIIPNMNDQSFNYYALIIGNYCGEIKKELGLNTL